MNTMSLPISINIANMPQTDTFRSPFMQVKSYI